MRARVVVFPIKGRDWCFSRSIDPSVSTAYSNSTSAAPSTVKDLWKSLSSSSSTSARPLADNAELIIDFVSNKMNKAWDGLAKAPERSFKSKIHGVGIWLLSRVNPSEIFLKSMSKEVTAVEITYPMSLNARLVRRRLRHIAMRGTIIHKKYLYGSVTLLPLTSVFMVLPLPNIPFFWMLFRTYSHWRALQGSEKLLQLVSDGSGPTKETESDCGASKDGGGEMLEPLWVLHPSKELEKLLSHSNGRNGPSDCVLLDICKTFHLNAHDVSKYGKKSIQRKNLDTE